MSNEQRRLSAEIESAHKAADASVPREWKRAGFPLKTLTERVAEMAMLLEAISSRESAARRDYNTETELATKLTLELQAERAELKECRELLRDGSDALDEETLKAMETDEFEESRECAKWVRRRNAQVSKLQSREGEEGSE